MNFASNEVLKSGFSLLTVAREIATTPEFLQDHATPEQFGLRHQPVSDGLGRAIDAGGQSLVGSLNAGQIGRGDALYTVASSAEAHNFLTRVLP